MEKFILILLLGMESIVDMKEKRILVIIPFTYMMGMFLWRWGAKDIQWLDVMAILFTLAVMYGISIITREAMGKGDVWLMGMVMASMKYEQAFLAVMVSFFLAAIFSMCYLTLSKRKSKHTCFPFAPFLCVGTLMVVGMEMGVFE